MSEIFILSILRCLLCGKVCLFTIDSVHAHVSSSHRMNWSAYKEQYLSPGGEDTTLPDTMAEERDDFFMDLPLQVESIKIEQPLYLYSVFRMRIFTDPHQKGQPGSVSAWKMRIWTVPEGFKKLNKLKTLTVPTTLKLAYIVNSILFFFF